MATQPFSLSPNVSNAPVNGSAGLSIGTQHPTPNPNPTQNLPLSITAAAPTQPAPTGFNAANFITTARQKGIPDEQIYQYLQSNNLIAGQSSSNTVSAAAPATSKIGGIAKTIGKALTSSENAAGNDIAGAIIPSLSITKQAQASSDAADANIQKLTEDLHQAVASGDTAKAQQISTYLKGQGVDVSSFNVSQVDPTLAKSNAQVAGDFGGVLLDVLSSGSYGEAAKGAETGKLLTSSDKVASVAGKLGIDTTKQVAEKTAKKVGVAAAKEIGAKSLEGAVQGYGYDVSNNLQSGKKGLSALKPGLATAAGAILPGASKVSGELLKGTAGVLSGATKDVLQRAIDNPDAVQEAINTYAKDPEKKAELVSQVNSGIQSYLNDRSQEYGSALKSLKPTENLSTDATKNAFMKSVADFGGSLDDKGNLQFSDSKLTEEDQQALKNTHAIISNWKDNSVEGMDNLRQRLKNEASKFNVNTGVKAEDKPIVDAMTALRSDVSGKTPGYSEMLKNYGDKSSTATQIKKELQIGGTAKDSTKLSNVMKIFKKDPKIVENLSKVMGEKEANEFLNQIAGAILSEWTGKQGLATKVGEIGGVAELARNPSVAGVASGIGGIIASSPRAAGTIATTIGKATAKGAGTLARRLAVKAASSLSENKD